MSSFNPFDDIDPIETGEWIESIDSVLTSTVPTVHISCSIA